MTNHRVDPVLRALVETSGPFLSLYLNTEGAREEAPRHIALSWRALRQGSPRDADHKALLLLDDAVEGSHRLGNGLVAITSGEEIALRRHLPTPIPDALVAGALPHLTPLLDWQQDRPTYAVVLSDRVGAEIHVQNPYRPDDVTEVHGDHDVIQKVKVGGTTDARFQRRAQDSWEQNAKAVAVELTRIAAREHVDFVVLAGDLRAIEFLKEHVGDAVRSLAFEIESEPPGIGVLTPALDRAAKAFAARTGEEILARFGNARGQAGRAAEGIIPTLQALQQSQVDTLLVSGALPERAAWVSISTAQGALERSDLEDLGASDAAECPLIDVLVYLALKTGAQVRVQSSGQARLGPSEGVGAILRFG